MVTAKPLAYTSHITSDGMDEMNSSDFDKESSKNGEEETLEDGEIDDDSSSDEKNTSVAGSPSKSGGDYCMFRNESVNGNASDGSSQKKAKRKRKKKRHETHLDDKKSRHKKRKGEENSERESASPNQKKKKKKKKHSREKKGRENGSTSPVETDIENKHKSTKSAVKYAFNEIHGYEPEEDYPDHKSRTHSSSKHYEYDTYAASNAYRSSQEGYSGGQYDPYSAGSERYNSPAYSPTEGAYAAYSRGAYSAKKKEQSSDSNSCYSDFEPVVYTSKSGDKNNNSSDRHASVHNIASEEEDDSFYGVSYDPNQHRDRSPIRSSRYSERGSMRRNRKSPSQKIEYQQVCKFFREGNCNKADKCHFLHQLPMDNGKKLQLCPNFLTEKCDGSEDCNYMHSEYPCKAVFIDKFCLRDTECIFSHDELNEQSGTLVRRWREALKGIDDSYELSALQKLGIQQIPKPSLGHGLLPTPTKEMLLERENRVFAKPLPAPAIGASPGGCNLKSLLDLAVAPSQTLQEKIETNRPVADTRMQLLSNVAYISSVGCLQTNDEGHMIPPMPGAIPPNHLMGPPPAVETGLLPCPDYEVHGMRPPFIPGPFMDPNMVPPAMLPPGPWGPDEYDQMAWHHHQSMMMAGPGGNAYPMPMEMETDAAVEEGTSPHELVETEEDPSNRRNLLENNESGSAGTKRIPEDYSAAGVESSKNEDVFKNAGYNKVPILPLPHLQIPLPVAMFRMNRVTCPPTTNSSQQNYYPMKNKAAESNIYNKQTEPSPTRKAHNYSSEDEFTSKNAEYHTNGNNPKPKAVEHSDPVKIIMDMVSKKGEHNNTNDQSYLSKVALAIDMPATTLNSMVSNATSRTSMSGGKMTSASSSSRPEVVADPRASRNNSFDSNSSPRDRRASNPRSYVPPGTRPAPIRRRLSTSELNKEPVLIPLHSKTPGENRVDPRIAEGRLYHQPRIYFVANVPVYHTTTDMDVPPTPNDYSSPTATSRVDPRLQGMQKCADPRVKVSKPVNDPRLRNRSASMASPSGRIYGSNGDLHITEAACARKPQPPPYIPETPAALLKRPQTHMPSLPKLNLAAKKAAAEALAAGKPAAPMPLPKKRKLSAYTPQPPKLMRTNNENSAQTRVSPPPAKAETPPAAEVIAPYDPRYMTAACVTVPPSSYGVKSSSPPPKPQTATIAPVITTGATETADEKVAPPKLFDARGAKAATVAAVVPPPPVVKAAPKMPKLKQMPKLTRAPPTLRRAPGLVKKSA